MRNTNTTRVTLFPDMLRQLRNSGVILCLISVILGVVYSMSSIFTKKSMRTFTCLYRSEESGLHTSS